MNINFWTRLQLFNSSPSYLPFFLSNSPFNRIPLFNVATFENWEISFSYFCWVPITGYPKEIIWSFWRKKLIFGFSIEILLLILPCCFFHSTTNRSIFGLDCETDQDIRAVLEVTLDKVRFSGDSGGSRSTGDKLNSNYFQRWIMHLNDNVITPKNKKISPSILLFSWRII